jgi:lysophospholipase L1-like esterase
LIRFIAARLPYYPAVPASLLVFPSAVPWAVLGWGLLALVQIHRGRSAWLALSMSLFLLLLKRLDLAPWILLGLVPPALALLFAARFLRRRNPEARPGSLGLGLGAPALLAGVAALLLGSHVEETRSRPLNLAPERPIVVLGDSLSVHGWPRDLAKLVSVPVIDRSEGGINTIEGLARLPEVLSLHPQLVVVELGGHDYLEGRSRSSTEENLDRIIREVRGAGAEVLVFEIPRGFIYDPFRCLERDLARRRDFELLTDGAIRELVLFSPFTPLGSLTGRKLSDDGLHPNEAGHRFLAERVKRSLLRLYGPTILAAAR